VETPTTTATGALKAPTAAALETAGELLAARRTALGESSGLSPTAGIEGRALLSEVATPGTATKLRRAKVGALS
jgi:hypothetical protein